MLCVYEDESARNFGPLVDLRAVFELRCGMRSFLEKIRQLYPRERIVLWVREELAEVMAERYPNLMVNMPVEKPALFVAAGTILYECLPSKGKDCVFVSSGRIVGARLNQPPPIQPSAKRTEDRRPRPALSPLKKVMQGDPIRASLPASTRLLSEFRGLVEKEVKAKVIQFPWELIETNIAELQRELKFAIKGRKRLTLGRGARVDKGAFISTESGPVFLDRGSKVRPGSFVEGPCYIGPGTIIDGAIVRPGCSFGPQCRIGGEVEASVFQGYANKHHEGFLGHSFVGEWVNLGAMTTSSDLRNNYKLVKVPLRGKVFDTGMLHLGCFIGDHAKMGIGTLLPTGSVIGTFANWYEGGFVPKELASFSWDRREKWRAEEMIDCARRVMARRGVEMSLAYERLLLRRYQEIVPDVPSG